MKPQLFIIAGANGAGKTSYAHEHVLPGTFIFNGDNVYAELLKKHPNYDPDLLKGGVPQQLEKDINQSIAAWAHFGFETNYATDMTNEVVRTFTNAGYETNLIFFGLESLQSAAIRVDHRVALGGHNLTTQEIKTNFENGLERAKASLKLYNTIKFIDTGIVGLAPVIAYYIKNTGKHVVMNNNIEWFNKQFKQPLLNLAVNRINEINNDISLQLLQKKGKDRGEDFNLGYGGPKIGR